MQSQIIVARKEFFYDKDIFNDDTTEPGQLE